MNGVRDESLAFPLFLRNKSFLCFFKSKSCSVVFIDVEIVHFSQETVDIYLNKLDHLSFIAAHVGSQLFEVLIFCLRFYHIGDFLRIVFDFSHSVFFWLNQFERDFFYLFQNLFIQFQKLFNYSRMFELQHYPKHLFQLTHTLLFLLLLHFLSFRKQFL